VAGSGANPGHVCAAHVHTAHRQVRRGIRDTGSVLTVCHSSLVQSRTGARSFCVVPAAARQRAVALATAAACLALAIGASGCGRSGGESTGGASAVPRVERPPARLAALYRRANALVDADRHTLAAQLRALRGYPVVVNKWASWCGPCRSEFPLLRRAALRFGRQVAFLGLNSEDARGPARDFLRSEPVPYPSLRDARGELAADLGADRIFPATVFFDRSGGRAHVKYGPYRSLAEIRTDLARYAR